MKKSSGGKFGKAHGGGGGGMKNSLVQSPVKPVAGKASKGK